MKERFKAFTVLIAKINRNIRRIKTEVMSEYNLKCPHVSCLYYLYSEGPLTAKKLCEVCDEDKGAISRSVDFLINEGYIDNDVSDGKKYKNPLRLTEKGKIVGGVIANKIDEVLSVASDGVTAEDRAVMYKSLACISENLQKIGEIHEGEI